MTYLKQLLIVCLVLALSVALLPADVYAQTSGASGDISVSSSSEDDEYTEKILVGLFVVILCVLGYVAWQSDREWSNVDEDELDLFASESDAPLLLLDGDGASVGVKF